MRQYLAILRITDNHQNDNLSLEDMREAIMLQNVEGITVDVLELIEVKQSITVKIKDRRKNRLNT